MSAAAMLVYPDFFKVAFSESGNHENNIYNNTWSEKNHGIKEVEKDGKVTFEFDIEKNSELAKNLKGHLMLVHGEIDNNVHPANTYRLADALIKANKRFDMFIVPGARHAFGDASAYVNWLRGDYFCAPPARHLVGERRHRRAESRDAADRGQAQQSQLMIAADGCRLAGANRQQPSLRPGRENPEARAAAASSPARGASPRCPSASRPRATRTNRRAPARRGLQQ